MYEFWIQTCFFFGVCLFFVHLQYVCSYENTYFQRDTDIFFAIDLIFLLNDKTSVLDNATFQNIIANIKYCNISLSIQNDPLSVNTKFSLSKQIWIYLYSKSWNFARFRRFSKIMLSDYRNVRQQVPGILLLWFCCL